MSIHKTMLASDVMRRSLFWWRMCDLLHWSITLYRRDVCCDLMQHLPCVLFPPIFDLPLSLKSIFPLLAPGCQASGSWCLSFCHSTIFVGMPPQLIGLVCPIRQSSICLKWKVCICPHAWQRSLLWGPNCCQQ